jgi:hypothetical protein
MTVLTPSASRSPKLFWMIVMATAMSSVFPMACRASGSRASSRKFSSPTNARSGLRPSQSVKAYQTPRALGMSTTKANRAIAGAANHHGGVVRRRPAGRAGPGAGRGGADNRSPDVIVIR